MKDGIAAAAIHGNRSQSQRIRALNDFKAGRVSILVATEVAARGIDIEELPHVVNFELPMAPEDYLHRIGRTGRAGIEGDAISFVCVDEDRLLRDIERLLGRQIEVEIVAGLRARSLDPAPGDPPPNRDGGRGTRAARPVQFPGTWPRPGRVRRPRPRSPAPPQRHQPPARGARGRASAGTVGRPALRSRSQSHPCARTGAPGNALAERGSCSGTTRWSRCEPASGRAAGPSGRPSRGAPGPPR